MPAKHPSVNAWLFLTEVIVLLILLQTQRSNAFSLCKTSSQVDNCLHGQARDFCGNMVCAKGPGGRCGGPSNVHGRCGEGMHCKCETCIGCSIDTLECHFGRTTCY